MNGHKTHQQVMTEALKDPVFRSEWEVGAIQREITKAILRERIERHMSQGELAQRSGMKQPSLARVESGGYMPSIPTLTKVAQALGKRLEVKFV
jgi:ribosome-binding protein aMBF1 (putative translation factor)